jgi:phosphoglycerate kinase
MANYKTIEEVDVKGKRVLVRLDLNVPLKKGEIKDDTRINASLETIKYLIGKDAKVILMSHLGRPEGKVNPKFSLKVVADALSKKLNMDVTMAPDCVGEKVEAIVKEMKDGEVILLENLRFHGGEEANEPKFVQGLANLANVYINDAFGTAHRAHASTAGVPLKMIKEGKEAAAGFLMKKELDIWKGVVHSQGTKVLVIGGKKLKEKMKAIINLSTKCKYVGVGGVPYNVLHKAGGNNVGNSLVSEKNSDIDYTKQGQEIISKHNNIILGEEVVIAKNDGEN